MGSAVAFIQFDPDGNGVFAGSRFLFGIGGQVDLFGAFFVPAVGTPEADLHTLSGKLAQQQDGKNIVVQKQ